MELLVRIEPTAENCFRASSGDFNLAAEGTTQDEALARLSSLVKERVASGTRIRALKVDEEHPWMKFAGTLPDDELTRSWRQSIEEYRRWRDLVDELGENAPPWP